VEHQGILVVHEGTALVAMLSALLLVYASLVLYVSEVNCRTVISFFGHLTSRHCGLDIKPEQWLPAFAGADSSPVALILILWFSWAILNLESWRSDYAHVKHVHKKILKQKAMKDLEGDAQFLYKEQEVTIPLSGGDSICAVVTYPGERIPNKSVTNEMPNTKLAVVCTHPWPPLGGNMHNNVPVQLSRCFATCGHVAIRFSFRGNGFSRGLSEIDDVRAAAKFLMSEGSFGSEVQGKETDSRNLPVSDSNRGSSNGKVVPNKLVIVGYSYGSLVAGAAAYDIPEVAALITISSPSTFAWFLTLFNQRYMLHRAGNAPCPKLFIHGSRALFTSPGQLHSLVRKFFFPNTLKSEAKPDALSTMIVQGGDHFWNGFEVCLFSCIRDFMHDLSCGATATPRHSGAKSQRQRRLRRNQHDRDSENDAHD